MSAVIPIVAALGLLLMYEGATGFPRPRARGLLRALDELADEAGVAYANGPRLLFACAALGAIVFVAIAGTTSALPPAGACALACASAPIALLRARVRRRRLRLRDSWPDAVATLIASVRAGISLPETCAALADKGPPELRRGWAAFRSTFRATGSFDASLARLREELTDPVVDRIAIALSLAHTVGGTDLVRLLRTLGDFVRDDLRTRREIQARWSWTVTAARVAASAPWIVLLLMSSRPEAAAAYNSASGAVVIAAGGAATLLGYRLMLRAARLPEQRRLSP